MKPIRFLISAAMALAITATVAVNNAVAKSVVGILVARDRTSQITLRNGPGMQFNSPGYGLVGDAVDVLDVANDSSGNVWYKVKFPRSGAEGWIRGDYLYVILVDD